MTPWRFTPGREQPSASIVQPLNLEFEPFVAGDVGALASWLASEPWPFHGLRQQWTEAEVAAAVSAGEFTDANRSVWVLAGDTRVGLLRFRWLDETSPDVDVRVLARYRGRGVGTAMLEWAATYVFTETERHRLSGETRFDNLAMRRVFEHCGWTQEAHYRASWPDGRGGWSDSVAYAILRDEWAARSRGAARPLGMGQWSGHLTSNPSLSARCVREDRSGRAARGR